MTLVYCYVINKEMNKPVYVDCRLAKAEEYIAKQENAENFFIAYKTVRV